MHHKYKLAISVATACVALIPTAASATTVSVRSEGASKTLLPTTSTVVPASGSVTKGGAPAGACPAASAAGALDVATKGNWVGKYFAGTGIFVNAILGESYASSKSSFWGFWVNYKFSQLGICATTLHPGDRVLFAPHPDTGKAFPLALTVSGKKKVGKTIKVKVVWYSDAGVAKPLAGAHVSYGAASKTTNSKGIVKIKIKKTGTLKLGATDTGYIRAAVVKVHVKT
jgi:hypothetical protein